MTALYQYCEKCKTERGFRVSPDLFVECVKCGARIKTATKKSYSAAAHKLIDDSLAKSGHEDLKPYVDMDLIEEICTYGTGAKAKGMIYGTPGSQTPEELRQIEGVFLDPASYPVVYKNQQLVIKEG